MTDLRGILKYVPQYRGKIFVIAIDGCITESEDFSNLLLDVAVLRSLNIQVVLVHGIHAQLEKRCRQQGFSPSDLDGQGITDARTLETALLVANQTTHEILRGLSAAGLYAANCNGVTAYPMGIIRGEDHLFTGKVEKIDTELFQSLLEQDIIPVVPPLGFDGGGHTWRVNSDSIAETLGVALKASKIIYISDNDGIFCDDKMIRNIQSQLLKEKLQDSQSHFLPYQISKINFAITACEQGISRVHFINGLKNESLLAEVFSNEGIGSMVYENEYQQIRQATKKDIRTILRLIRQSVEKEELTPRTADDIEARISDYYLFETDNHPIACVALHISTDGLSGELACLYVSPTHENQGIGMKLIHFVEDLAREAHIKKIVVLSTQTYTYFASHAGYKEGSINDLTAERLISYQQNCRKSKILIKHLHF